MKVVYSAQARSDLIEIGVWIAQDNPSRAESFVDELRDACESLADVPRRFPLVPRHRNSGIRRRPYGNYLIFYRVSQKSIDILHVLHGARDSEAILFRHQR